MKGRTTSIKLTRLMKQLTGTIKEEYDRST